MIDAALAKSPRTYVAFQFFCSLDNNHVSRIGDTRADRSAIVHLATTN